jgi:hypothetical protein
MKSATIIAVAVGVAFIAAIGGANRAQAFDLQACMAKCKDRSCKEQCEVAANREMDEQGTRDACEGREDPKTHVISFAHCK